MTQSTRTVAQITSSIDFLVKAINDMDAHVQELRNMRGLDHFYVLGFDYGLFLTTRPGYVAKALGGFTFARKFDSARAARLNTVYNGRGEAARVYRHDDALKLVLRLQEHALDGLRECLVGCQLELNDAYALERAADQAAWEDSFQVQLRADIERAYEDEQERKAPRSRSLRSAAARIADSREFFNVDADGYEDPF